MKASGKQNGSDHDDEVLWLFPYRFFVPGLEIWGEFSGFSLGFLFEKQLRIKGSFFGCFIENFMFKYFQTIIFVSFTKQQTVDILK